MKKRRKITGAFLSYLQMFLTLSLSLIVLFASSQYILSYRMLTETAQESSRNSLLLLTNTHEMILDQVDESIDPLMDNDGLLNYMDYFRRNLHNTCMTIIDQVINVAKGNHYIQSVCIYYPKDDYSLSSDFGPSSLEWYYDAEFLQQLTTMSNPQRSVYRREIVNQKAEELRVLTLVRTMPVFATSSQPKAYIVVNLDENAIAESLRLLSNDSSIALLVTDAQKNVIGTVGMDNEAEIAQYTAIELEKTEMSTSCRLQVSGHEMLVQFMRNSRGWMYYFVQPASVVMGGISQMQNTLLSVCALVLLVSVVLSFLFSHRMYEPIRTISDRFESILGEDGTKCDRKIQGIISRVDSLITRNVQLENEWRRSVRENRELCFYQLVQEDASAGTRREELMLSLHMEPETGVKSLMIAVGIGALSTQALWKWNELLEKMKLQLPVMFFPKGEYAVVLLARSEQELSSDEKSVISHFWLTQGAQKVEIGEPFMDGEYLREEWQRMMRKCGLRPIEQSQVAIYETEDENNLLRAIKNGDMKSTRNTLDAFLLHLIRKEVDMQTIHGAYQRLYDSVSQLILENDSENKPKADAETESLASWDKRMESLCAEIIEQMTPRDSGAYSKVISDVCAYIDANLSEDLSLDQLAMRFHVSASNLRRLFRSEIGMTPKEYVDGRRVLAAKHMLREQDLQIQEIARQLGFQYSQSFIAFFRAMEKVTPGEYRARQCGIPDDKSD